MTARLRLFWDTIHSSYWFLPTLLLVAGGGTALILTEVDSGLDQDGLGRITGIFRGGPEGARSVMLAVASSVLGVAGTVFSITIAVLSLTSSQFGPRLLRNFLKDTGNQIVLGTFIGTFLYALLVLRTIRSTDESPFVPHISVTLGLALAVVSVGMLVYFIQHTVASIQASQIIRTAGEEFVEAVDRLYPSGVGQASGPVPGPFDLSGHRFAAVRASSSGYLQAVDGETLVEAAREHGGVIRLLKMPGQFIGARSIVAEVTPDAGDAALISRRINGALSLGPHATQVQDVTFAINQLSEIAVRALSPGINDPNTALMCIDRLNVGLCALAQREFPSPYRADAEGALRVVARTATFSDLLDTAYDQIRRYGRQDAQVLTHLLNAFADIASCTEDERTHAALRRHRDLVSAEAREGINASEGQTQVLERHAQVAAAARPPFPAGSRSS